MGVLTEPEPEPDRPADPRRAALLLRWSRVLRWSAAATLLLTVPVAVWAVEVEEPVVVARAVVSPLVVGPGLAGLGSALALAAAAVGLAACERGAARGSRRGYVRWPVNVAKLVLLLGGCVAAGLAALLGLALGDAHLLLPASPAGCRVVAVERTTPGRATVDCAPPAADGPS